MKIDLHVHAKERSACSVAGEEELIKAAIACGLDGLAFTDHHRLVELERLADLNRKYAAFRVFGGIEITVSEGEDLLVLGVHDPALETRGWGYRELFAFVRERDGFLALAHPFRFYDTIRIDVEQYPPDAVEIRSMNTSACNEQRIRALLERLNLRPLCNSDAHRADHVGAYYNQLERAPRDEKDLFEILRTGAYTCGGAKDRITTANRAVVEERGSFPHSNPSRVSSTTRSTTARKSPVWR